MRGLHGKVEVWYMTESERLAYIEKYPIVSTEKTPGSSFANINETKRKAASSNGGSSRKEKPSVLENIDKDEFHKLFVSGKRLADIAFHFGISESTVSYFLKEQRKIEPEKWERRNAFSKRKSKWG